MLAMVGGCNSAQQTASDDVDSGEVALGGGRFDTAVSDADAAIKAHPTAEAYYLRGRAEEDRPKPDNDITIADLDRASADYQAALNFNPGQPLESRCRAGIANVAFSRGNYDLALFQWNSAVNGLDEPQWKARALYGIGVCLQRLGRFDDADKTFDRLRSEFPDQEITARGMERRGIRGFYVQIGAFAKLPDAQAAQKTAQDNGLKCRQVSDQGLIAVRGGPYDTYADALRGKALVAGQFPDAIIGP
jgi:tetratricopeptide (TPR) repeat protein